MKNHAKHDVTKPGSVQKSDVSTGAAPSMVHRMQSTLGNQAVMRLVQSRIQRVSSTDRPVIQLRGENPHAQAGSHQGWDLTAHHVVAHSKLVGALDSLSDTQRAEVLREAIPDTLTKAMLDNLKVELEDSAEAREELREKLASTASDDEEVSSIRLGDMRRSFFEWQGGNQFQGPNTSIRPEPSASKDDLDHDGEYFTPMSAENFGKLKGLGQQLDGELGEAEKAKVLKDILALTKNVTPDPFDATKWQEVGTLDELTTLVSNTELKRGHLLNYAFFKFGMDQIGEGKTYDKITGGSGDYFFGGKKIGLQAKGTLGYLPITAAKDVIPTTEASVKLNVLLTQLNAQFTAVDKEYVIDVDNDVIKKEGTTKFKVKGYDDAIPCKAGDTPDKIKAAKGMVDNRQMKTITALPSLYDYCESNGMATSSFLPKALYDQISST